MDRRVSRRRCARVASLGVVRWEALFEDLQGQWDAARRAEDDARIADLAELEMGRTHLADRVRACRGGVLTVRLSDGSEVSGPVLDAAPGWVLLGVGERRCVVPMTAVVVAWPLGSVAPQAGTVERRLGLSHVLRAIAREGATVRVRVAGTALRGRVVRVGADHLDVATEPVDRAARGVVTVALSAVVALESVG